jgi:PAS domain S-box-containing protein
MADIRDENTKMDKTLNQSDSKLKSNTIDPIIKDELVFDSHTNDKNGVIKSTGIDFNSIGDGALIIDLDLNIISLNKSAEKLTGWNERDLSGSHIENFFKIIRENNKDSSRFSIDSVVKNINKLNNCLLVPTNSSGASLRVSASPIKNEIGDIKQILLVLKSEDDFKNLDISNYYKFKHDNFVTITRGLLHDVNNYFTPLLANLSLLKMNADKNDESYERILQCEMSCIKAIDFMQKFSLISETSELKKEIESISEIVSSSVDLIFSGTNIKCEFCISDSLKPVEVDKNKIVLSLYNILKIYRESMTDGGVLIISIQNFEYDQVEYLPLTDKEYIKITIEDKSNHVNFEDLEFNSDYSFNSQENTNALGLTLSFNIIKEHGGLFDYDYIDDHTKVYIYLPSCTEDVLFLKEDNRIPEDVEESPNSDKAKLRVLVMDDNELVAGTLAEMLVRLECSVFITHSGEEASRNAEF